MWGRFLFTDIRVMGPLITPSWPDAIRFLDSIGELTRATPRSSRPSPGAHAGVEPVWFTTTDLGPTWTQPPFEHGWDLAPRADDRMMRPVTPANLLGLPSAAVPAGQAGGLPAGVQVMGARFQELACLEAAEAIEQRLGAAQAIVPDPGAFRRHVTLRCRVRKRTRRT